MATPNQVMFSNNPVEGTSAESELVIFRSELSEYNVSHEIREYTISIQMFYAGTNIKKNILDHILRKVSHLEALIQNNISMTLTDSSDCFNCRLESTELNTGEDEEYYLVEWVWIGQHMENVG